MAPNLLDRHDMLFPEAISTDVAVATPALVGLSNGLRAGKQNFLVSCTKIFETFETNRRLQYCI